MRDELANALTPADARDDLTLRVGVVSGTSPLEVTLSGQSGLSAARLASYTAVAADPVLIAQTKTDLIILGKIVTGG